MNHPPSEKISDLVIFKSRSVRTCTTFKSMPCLLALWTCKHRATTCQYCQNSLDAKKGPNFVGSLHTIVLTLTDRCTDSAYNVLARTKNTPPTRRSPTLRTVTSSYVSFSITTLHSATQPTHAGQIKFQKITSVKQKGETKGRNKFSVKNLTALYLGGVKREQVVS